MADSSKAKLESALEMGGVNKLHRRGIKGKGIKIGIIDTGADYRLPDLGAGFGPGHKIAGAILLSTTMERLAKGLIHLYLAREEVMALM